jgi:LuxR family maltose regulon positive regulatory protein
MLIRTKLSMPPLRTVMLDRTHLVTKLSTRKDRRLIMIVGQAGSGKTSLVSQWITQNSLQYAWYSLDEHDNQRDLFFRYLLAALAGAGNKTEQENRLFRRGQRSLSTANMLPIIIDFAENLSVDTYLVLDDYHVITSKEVHEAVSSILDYLPPKMHIVLISRRELPFSLSKLKVRDQMTEISAEELMLTEKERMRFLSEIVPLALPLEQLRTLSAYSDGWLGGLQLIGLSLQGKENARGFAEALNAIRHTTSDYLINEVINIQPEKVKAFLSASVLLNRFNADLCREITGIEEASVILDYLHRINLFLVPLDTERTWYSYHQMFSEALKANTEITSPDRRSRIHQKAAVWFARHGYLEDAFQHAFASGDIDFAADLMEGYILYLLERYEVRSVRRWISMLPRDVLTDHPLLKLHECWPKIVTLDVVGFEAIIKDLEDRLEDILKRYKGPKRKLFLDHFIFAKYMLSYCKDPATVDVSSMKEASTHLSIDERYGLQTWMAECLRYQGGVSMAETVLNEVPQRGPFLRNTLWVTLWFRFMAFAKKYQGDLKGAESVLNGGLYFVREKQLHDGTLEYFFYVPMALIFYARNELEKAKRYVINDLRVARNSNFATDIVDASFLLAMINMAMGKPERANACMRRVEALSKTSRAASFVAFSRAYIASVCLMQGNLEVAEAWAKQRRLSLEEPFSIRFVFESLLQARIYYYREMYEEAGQMMEKLRRNCVERNMLEAVLEIDILCSATLYASNRHKEAKELMMKAIAFAEAQGYVRPFVDYWPFVSTLLLDIARYSTCNSRYLYVILEASNISPESSIMKRQVLTEKNAGLTEREKEVLRLIASGYTNSEIATKSFVSRNTVKTHVTHIFEKLGVKTRVQAMVEAKHLGLF